MMGFEDIRAAVEVHATDWQDAPLDIDGVPKGAALQAAISANETWCRLTINHGASITAGIGSAPCVRRTGIIDIQVFTPEHSGSRPAAVIADSLAEHWEYYLDGDLETQAVSVQRVGPTDGWYMYLASTPFRAG